VVTRILVIIASVAVIAVVVGAMFVLRGAEPKSSTSSEATPNASSSPSAGLKSTDEVVGTGTEAVTGKTVSVHYTGTLQDGTKFDSSRDRNQPFEFRLGQGEVIKGWDQGVVGMKVGGKRKLVIPPDLGYGSQDKGTIPPNSTLLFDVELLEVK
jgi:peptidylprolyl isomerase